MASNTNSPQSNLFHKAPLVLTPPEHIPASSNTDGNPTPIQISKPDITQLITLIHTLLLVEFIRDPSKRPLTDSRIQALLLPRLRDFAKRYDLDEMACVHRAEKLCSRLMIPYLTRKEVFSVEI